MRCVRRVVGVGKGWDGGRFKDSCNVMWMGKQSGTRSRGIW
jgi:hypothetical protein